MKSSFLFILALTVATLSGCTNKSSLPSGESSSNIESTSSSEEDPSPKEFTPHELEYGGDIEETFTYEQFVELAKDNYQKSVVYNNGYATLTSDKSFYDENDSSDYFKDFDELRFVVIPINEDRSFAMVKLFFLLPVNFDYDTLSAYMINNYRVGRAISYLNWNINLENKNQLGDFDTFYKYKIKGDNIEMLFSKDYYPVKVTWTIESVNYEMTFKYYNINDLPRQTGEVDEETFLIHAYAKANQKLTVNHLKMDIELKDAIIGAIQKMDEEYGFVYIEYVYGTGTVTYIMNLTSLGVDKTALPLITDISKVVTQESRTDTFDGQDISMVHERYYLPVMDYFFNSYTAIHNAISDGWSRRVEQTYTIAPLSVTQRIYFQNEQTGEYDSLGKTFKYEFNNNGLISHFSQNFSSETKPDDASFTFTYSKV